MSNQSTKYNNSLQRIAPPYELNNLHGEEYASVLDALFHSEEFLKLKQHRDNLYKGLKRPGSNTFIIAEGIKKDDSRMANMLLSAMIDKSIRSSSVEEFSIKDLFKKLDLTNKDVQIERERLATKLNASVFMADILEMYICDANESLHKLFPNEDMKFEMFNGVRAMMKSLRDVFSLTRDKGTKEEQILFAETAESINSYMDKRINVFMRRCKKIRKE